MATDWKNDGRERRQTRQSSGYYAHSYVDGKVMNHKQIGNGCQLDYSYAKRCTICNKTIIYDLYYTGTWPTCPH